MTVVRETMYNLTRLMAGGVTFANRSTLNVFEALRANKEEPALL